MNPALAHRATKFLLFLFMVVAFPQASLATDFLKEGMADYAAGNYSDASGHFGGALSTDFNNATLHYYLGSCYAHMKQQEAAVREFRIAYALEPTKEVGRFAKQALEIYGFDPDGPVEKKPSATPLGALPGANSSALPPSSGRLPGAVVETPKPKTMLEKQAEDLKNLRSEQSRLASEDAGKQGERFVEKSKNDMLDSSRYITRRGRIVQPSLTSDDNKTLENLRKLYDSQKSSYLDVGARQNTEIQNTAASLQDQMNEQAKAGKLHLSPSGTNLYVRNYELTPAADSKPSGKTSTIQSVTNK
ncbi:MAG: hypothetical protein JST89_18405 [Cyanobacteria bacterium SZAS-4]|nr:hypothetical protein [Cyanobacteria bacterium SZAS-4]